MSEQAIGPGYHQGLPNDDYHAGPGVSKSQLDLLRRSPALLQWSRLAPEDDEKKAALNLGDAVHALILEPHRFEAEYAYDFQAPPGAITTADDVKAHLDQIGAEYKKSASKAVLEQTLMECDPSAPLASELRRKWEEGLGGRTILPAADSRKIQIIRESVMAHPHARFLVESEGDVEASIYWNDPITGELCRCRPDKALPKMGWLLDVKTTADMGKFSRSVYDYRYHVQDPFYSDGYAEHFGEPVRGFLFLVVSTSIECGRYPVRLFSLDQAAKDAGRFAYQRDLQVYHECRQSNDWPGIETLSLPPWAQ